MKKGKAISPNFCEEKDKNAEHLNNLINQQNNWIKIQQKVVISEEKWRFLVEKWQK